MVASVAFAPPWDEETRTFAATLPLFFLLPACGAGGLYLLTVSHFLQKTFEATHLSTETCDQLSINYGRDSFLGDRLGIMVVDRYQRRLQESVAPVASMKNDFGVEKEVTRSFDLRSSNAGYRLRVTDDAQPTWLPHISRKDFIQNIPTWPGYSSFSTALSQLPPGTGLVLLPYWVWLVLDSEDA
jgi:hypothetical protein